MNALSLKKLLFRFLPVLGLLLASLAYASSEVSVKLANQTDAEEKTERQLRRIFTDYDLTRWTFTHSVVIDEREIPHSHPTLTLHTRHLRDDDLLLSTYVHEQLHWFIAQHRAEVASAVRDLQRIYPHIPVGFPQGSSDEAGNYEHLLVIYLEYRADQVLLGELRASQVMKFWSEDHYTWIYREVLSHPRKIGNVLKAHGLVPE